jgi:hypothetical protein
MIVNNSRELQYMELRMDGNVHTENPESLLEKNLDAEYVLNGERTPSPSMVAAARNVANLLIEKDPLALALMIDHFAEHGGSTPTVDNAMVDLLEHKIREATPDRLSSLVQEAKVAGVWTSIKPVILKRNDDLATQVEEYNNLEALQVFLESVATSDSIWLPGPVFSATAARLRQLAREAPTVTRLDRIMEMARLWRMPDKVRKVVASCNAAFIASIVPFRTPDGRYRLHRGSERRLVEKPLVVVKMVEAGWTLVDPTS